MQCKVACNGHELGEHKGMFSRFAFDLTPHLKAGKNELTVWVSMEKFTSSTANLGEAVTVNLSAAKVISMSKGMFGPLAPNQDNRAYDLYGIWQPVKLVVRGSARITDVTFKPSLSGAQVDVEGEGQGLDTSRQRVLLTDVATGKKLADVTEPILNRVIFRGLNPKLWTPAEPNLYRLDVFLESPDGTVFDHWSHNVGFRTFEIKGNQFYLNGHRYWLRGANQLPYGKNPWDPSLARKLIQLLHDGNQRFTRTHATPWNEAWLDAADEIGLAVSIEGIRPWALAGKAEKGQKDLLPPPAIYQHWLMENEDVIKRCRNHPSVFLWTIGNEMNLRDNANIAKWKLLSGVVKQTRQADPTRPVVATSSYYREQKLYDEQMKPAGIDDGDIDDIHDYNAWYGNSNFFYDCGYAKQMKENQRKRPLIGQEMSTGYPDLDTGMPVMRYTRDLLTPQAWVGVYAYPGHDVGIWLDHHAKVTKRWAEMLRYQRGDNTAGFSMFSAECWFRHSYEPGFVKPYPVYEAMKQAFAPVGIALETTQRRFYIGDTIKANVFVTNDDDQFRDYQKLKLVGELGQDAGSMHMTLAAFDFGTLDKLDYYQTAKLPIEFKLTSAPTPRATATLLVRLMDGDKEIARTTENLEFFEKPAAAAATSSPATIVVKRGQPLAGLAEGQSLRQQVETGATAILFAPWAEELNKTFGDVVIPDAKKPFVAEFADWTPIAGTKLAKNLEPMDIKWWARKNDWRAFVAETSHRLKPGGSGGARELLRYIPPHSYIAADKLPEQYRTVLFEIAVGKGRVWVCDLDLDACAEIDPAARLFAENLYQAAADSDSTKNLPKVPSHEELLKGVKN
jgi:hypothetical protein